jgi:hypothetical protein
MGFALYLEPQWPVRGMEDAISNSAVNGPAGKVPNLGRNPFTEAFILRMASDCGQSTDIVLRLANEGESNPIVERVGGAGQPP